LAFGIAEAIDPMVRQSVVVEPHGEVAPELKAIKPMVREAVVPKSDGEVWPELKAQDSETLHPPICDAEIVADINQAIHQLNTRLKQLS